MNHPTLAALVIASALQIAGCENAPLASASHEAIKPAAPRTVAFPAKTYVVSDVDRRPVPVKRNGPHYPAEMRRHGIAGEAIVAFIIDTNGHVRDAYAVEATNAAFASAALEAVNSWEFTPAFVAGKPVNTRMQVPIRFTLNER